MIELIIISITAFLAAILTFFSGFGLGTILTPVLMVFLPVELAIALTGIVHFFNNIFKLLLVGKKADRKVLRLFGIPAIIAAIAGAWILLKITNLDALFSYSLAGHQFFVYPVKFLIAILLIIFALMDLLPYLKRLQFSEDKLVLGGILSGFFGGLSGNQGALRSAFLIRAGLSKESFIGTAVVISSLVDFTRLGVYATGLLQTSWTDHLDVVIIATLAAIAGAYIGNIMLKKVTIDFIQQVVGIFLIVLSVALGAGWL
jgi:uncharacterized protein